MKKILLLFIMGVTAVGLLVGCAEANGSDLKAKKTETAQSIKIKDDKNVEQEVKQETKMNQIVKEEGIYVGQIDGNFIEINIDGQPKTFMICEVRDIIGTLKENDKVQVDYMKNQQGQLILVNIEKID